MLEPGGEVAQQGPDFKRIELAGQQGRCFD
jgi:hypothetical protein